MSAGHGLRRENDLAVLLIGNHPMTDALRAIIEPQLKLFAAINELHIWVQEGTLYPTDEWEEFTECTFNYIGF